jgi:hypothetical protein
MKATLENGIVITLTDEQLKEIKSQLKETKYIHFTNIKSVEDAVDYLQLKEIPVTTYDKIKVVQKAINQLDSSEGNKIWYPYFEKSPNSLVGFGSSNYYCNTFDSQVALFKSENGSNYMGKTFFNLYQDLYKENLED